MSLTRTTFEPDALLGFSAAGAVFLAATFFAACFLAGVFFAAAFFAGGFLAACFFAVVFFAGVCSSDMIITLVNNTVLVAQLDDRDFLPY